MKLCNPAKLEKGDTIGIVSPSSGLANLFPHRVEKGKRMLEEMGFNVVFSKHSLEKWGWTSGSPFDRTNDLHEMFSRRDIKAIICTIGGNHSNQLLKYIDFDLVAKNKKIFLGYSDITVLHYAFAQKSNLRTFYGPCLMPEFGEYPEILPYTLKFFKSALMKTDPIGKIVQSDTWTDEFLDWFKKEDLTRPRTMNESKGYEWWQEGKAEGQIIGGAIPTLTYLAGTEYWIDPKGKLFFIDIPEGDYPGEPFSKSWLDTFLSNMDNLGVFSSISGLIIGRPYGYQNKDNEELKEIMGKYTKDHNFPILFNVNLGHTSPIITLPFGAKAIIDSENNNFEILESGVK